MRPSPHQSAMSIPNASILLKVAALAMAIVLTGCGGGDDGSGQTGVTPPVKAPSAETPPVETPSSNEAPTIQGTPRSEVLAGRLFSFQPTASDPDGDTLRFSGSNLPRWVSLDRASGRLTGTPGVDQVGTYGGIEISVTDGSTTASLQPFTINVVASAEGAATMSWTPPTENTDGSPLTDLAGYRISYGPSADDLSLTVTIQDPSINTYVIENLTRGPWYFAVAAVNSLGASSDPSAIGSKTIT